MKKEEVEIIVKALMEKLRMKEGELDGIMRTYTAKSSPVPIF